MDTSSLNATSIAEEISALQAFTQQLRLSRSISCCLLTLILLEILFTFDEEIIYIWRRPWSLFKIFFIQCRYLSIIPMLLIIFPPAPSNAYCVFFEWYISFVIVVVSLLPSSGLLAIRLDRLYASKPMRVILVTLVFVEITSQMAAALSILSHYSQTYNSSAHICGGNTSELSELLWISKSLIMLPYLVLICIYIGIATHAFIRHCRERRLMCRVQAVRRTFAPFYILFIRDGVVCYIVNFFGVLCGFVIITSTSRTGVLGYVGPAIIVGITSLSSCRLAMLLHGDPGHATGVYQVDTNEVHIEKLVIEDTNISSICTSL